MGRVYNVLVGLSLKFLENRVIVILKKDICANRCPTGATDRRLARFISLQLIAAYLVTGGRLFLCLVVIFAADGVSETETGQA